MYASDASEQCLSRAFQCVCLAPDSNTDHQAAFKTQLVFASLKFLLTQQCFYHVVFISWNYPWLLSSMGKMHQEAF